MSIKNIFSPRCELIELDSEVVIDGNKYCEFERTVDCEWLYTENEPEYGYPLCQLVTNPVIKESLESMYQEYKLRSN